MCFFSNHASRLEFHQLGFNEIVIWQVDLKYLVDTFFNKILREDRKLGY